MLQMNKSGWIYEKVKLEEAKGLGGCLDVIIEREVLRITCTFYFLPWAIESMRLFAENKAL